MILASIAKRSTLEELAEMADSVMEVGSASITMVATPQSTSDVGKFQAKMASLENNVRLYKSLDIAEIIVEAEATGGPNPVLHHSLGYANSTGISVVQLANVHLHA